MTKQELREKYKTKRRELSPGQLQSISDVVTKNVFLNVPVEQKIISLFLPIEKLHEINTYQLWEKAQSFGAQIAIPKVNPNTAELKHILFEHESQLELSPWGIPEPKSGQIIAADRFHIVFVPLLAVDKIGNRVGYGKGFYDSFLKKCQANCLFIGLNHFEIEQEVIEDIESHDIKLHACITPSGYYRFEK
jgi:5-formyltetrahydrofolate cyclo-ligase